MQRDFGTAAECILNVAQQRQPGLIVLGVRQPVGFVRRLKWATAYEVVANAPYAVPGTVLALALVAVVRRRHPRSNA